MLSLLEYSNESRVEKDHVWRPRALKREEWPPDYDAVYRWRAKQLEILRNDQRALASARTYYSTRPAEFIMDWMDTYDPRRKGSKWVPFVLFEKQRELIDFFMELERDQESGLLEKARDMGATWVACGYSDWCLIFQKDHAIGWGSRKQDLVDKAGDPDSIFEKMRLILRRLPDIWLPEGWNWRKNSKNMTLSHPDKTNSSYIGGESGDGIGRGGRKALYFKDEAAHYERPEKIESALGDNTNCQVDMSSVNGLGNVFHRRRENGVNWTPNADIPKGVVRVFIMDWRDHPGKTQEWYDARKAKNEREGMQHVFAQEVDRNYSAAVTNTIISMDWINAAVDAHIKVPYIAEVIEKDPGNWIAGLDVADEGGDKNALSITRGIVWKEVLEWGDKDPGETARQAINTCREFSPSGMVCYYDSIGIGASVKSEYNRLCKEIDPLTNKPILEGSNIVLLPWNAGWSVENPYERIVKDDDESLLNRDFFDNLKAQAWWSLRTRFYKTFKAVTEGVVYPVDELISLDSTMTLLEQLKKELAQPTSGRSSRLKMLVEKKPNGTKSPNLADSGNQAYFPVDRGATEVEAVATYGH